MSPTMTPRSHLRTTTAGLVAGAAALAALLSGCSGVGNPSAAAVVDGRVIEESEVQTVVEQLPAGPEGGTVTPQQVVPLMVVSGVVEDVAAAFTGPTSLDEAEQLLVDADVAVGRAPGTYDEPTLRIVAVDQMLGSIVANDLALAAFQEQVAELDVRLNPRYGQLPEEGIIGGVTPTTHEWLVQPEN